MFRFTLRAALVSLTAVAALALPAGALATNVTTWQIVQQNDPGASTTDQAPYEGVPTELVSPPFTEPPSGDGQDNPNPLSLVYGHATVGVDLTYTNLPNYQWEFIRQPGAHVTKQIGASERVALYNSVNRGYLADACKSGSGCIGRPVEAYGINLYWSATPSYEWQVFKGGDPQLDPSYADLYDSVEGGYLIPWADFVATALGEVQLGWIHAPFATGPDYIPPALPVTTTQQGNVVRPPSIKGP